METRRIVTLAVVAALAFAAVAAVGTSAHDTTTTGASTHGTSTTDGNAHETTTADGNETESGSNQTAESGDNRTTESGDNRTTESGDNRTTESGDNRTAESGGGMRMQMVEDGLVVNANTETLPAGCTELNGTTQVSIAAGREFAEPGNMFSYDTDRIQVPTCTRVTVTFVNRDDVRHQWMLHGLPKETYPMKMFMVTAEPNGTVNGTFITPATDQTLRTHCSLPQHEQKGMHMEIVIGDGGDGSHGGHGGHSHRGAADGRSRTVSRIHPAALVAVAGIATVILGGLFRYR